MSRKLVGLSLLVVGLLGMIVLAGWVTPWIGHQEIGREGARRYLVLVLEQGFCALPIFVGLFLLFRQVLPSRMTETARIVLKRRATVWVAALISLSGSYLIASGVYEFQPRTNGDEYAYQFQAKLLSSGRLFAPSPPVPKVFDGLVSIDYGGRWFTQTFPGHPAILVPGVLLDWPWLSVALVSVLAVFAAAALAGELFDQTTGSIAALLIAISPQVLFMQGSTLAQPSSALLLLLFMYLTTRALKKPGLLLALLSGLSWGGLFLIRPPTACTFGLVWLIWIAWKCLSPNSKKEPTRRSPQVRWGILVLLGVGCAAGVVAYLAYNAAMVGEWLRSPYSIHMHGDPLGTASLEVSSKIVFTMVNLLKMNFYLFGWPVSLLFLGYWLFRGAPVMALRVATLAGLAQCGFYLFYFANYYWYWYELYIPMTLVTAWGFADGLAEKAEDKYFAGRGPLAIFLSGSICSAVFVVPFLAALFSDYIRPRNQFFEDLPRLTGKQILVVQSLPHVEDLPLNRYNGLNDPDLLNERLFAIEAGPDTLQDLRRTFPRREILLYGFDQETGKMVARPESSPRARPRDLPESDTGRR